MRSTMTAALTASLLAAWLAVALATRWSGGFELAALADLGYFVELVHTPIADQVVALVAALPPAAT